MPVICSAHRTTTHGFTVLNLIATLGILGVISGIAVQTVRSYRQDAFDVRALEDLRNVIAAEEAYFADTEHYQEDVRKLPAFNKENASPEVKLILLSTENSWTARTWHPGGTTTYCYDSDSQLGIQHIPGLNQPCP